MASDYSTIKYIREYRRSKGLCTKCGSVLDREGATCTHCADRQILWNKRRFENNHSKGLCSDCGKPKEQISKSRCNTCLERQRNRGQEKKLERKKAGLCVQCGAVAVKDQVLCLPCKTRKNALRRKKKDGDQKY